MKKILILIFSMLLIGSLSFAAASGNGLRVVSKPFLVELFSDPSGMSTASAEASAVGEYSTTITFELVTL